jgi:hypothetical protein
MEVMAKSQVNLVLPRNNGKLEHRLVKNKTEKQNRTIANDA